MTNPIIQSFDIVNAGNYQASGTGGYTELLPVKLTGFETILLAIKIGTAAGTGANVVNLTISGNGLSGWTQWLRWDVTFEANSLYVVEITGPINVPVEPELWFRTEIVRTNNAAEIASVFALVGDRRLASQRLPSEIVSGRRIFFNQPDVSAPQTVGTDTDPTYEVPFEGMFTIDPVPPPNGGGGGGTDPCPPCEDEPAAAQKGAK